MVRPRHTAAAVAVEDIVIPQGADWSLPWLYSEDDALPAGWPDDWSGRAAVRASYGGELLASFRTGGVVGGGEVVLQTVTIDSDDKAQVSLVLGHAESAAMTWADQADCVHQLELVHTPTGRVVRMVEGKATLSAEGETSA